MPARDILHDVSFDLLVLQYRVAVVDQDGWRGGLEIGTEIGRRLLHVHGGHFQRNRLQLRQKVQVHKIFLTEEAGALSTAIDRRCLKTIFSTLDEYISESGQELNQISLNIYIYVCIYIENVF